MNAAFPGMDPAAESSLRARFRAGPLARAIARIDVSIYRFVRSHEHAYDAHRIVGRASKAGEYAGVWLAIGATGAIVDRRRRGAWLRAVRAVLGAFGLNIALKNVVRRKRPALEGLPALVKTPSSLSFPSAHASSSFAAARAFGPLVGPGATGALYAGATAMAWSRVYLGVHYPSDVAAGALLGTLIGGVAR